MKKPNVSLLVAAIVLAGCGGGETVGTSAADASTSRIEKAREAAKESGIDPCALLDETLVRAHFDLAGAELASRASGRTAHPLCTVSWRKPNAAEIEKETQAKMMEYMQAKARGEDVKMPSFRTENEVSLTVNLPAFENEESAAAGFDSAMKQLEQGFKDKDNPDAPPQFQFDTEPVAGVAQQASWTAGLNQLSVRSGLYIFHVTVNTGDSALNQEKAKAIATDLAGKLGG